MTSGSSSLSRKLYSWEIRSLAKRIPSEGTDSLCIASAKVPVKMQGHALYGSTHVHVQM